MWALADAEPHPRNPRKHPKPGSPKWNALKKSIELDYFDPIVVNRRNGKLVSGHLRRAVMMEMGITHATVVVVDYDEATHLARLIAANTLLGEFEETLLSQLARELETAGIEAGLAGLTDKDMMALVGGPTTVDDDEEAEALVTKAEQLQEKWQVKPGDLYQIGAHRLMCGECESMDNWQLLLGGRLADMMWTDPPYNVAQDSAQQHRNDAKRLKGEAGTAKPQALLNDQMSDKQYAGKLRAWYGMASMHLKPGAPIYIAHAESKRCLNEAAAVEAGFHIAQTLVWVKQAFTLGRQDYQWQHEPILYGWKPGAAHYWQGGFCQATVIDEEQPVAKMSKAQLVALVNELRNAREGSVVREPRQVSGGLHPTIKPLRLVARHVWNSSRRGDTVKELFGGSGTTLAAAEQTGRQCVATEQDPKYCAVILERMSAYGLTITKVHELG